MSAAWPYEFLNENDRRYVEHGGELIAEWARLVGDPSYSDDDSIMWHCITDQCLLLGRIANGQPSPWHDNPPEDFIATMRAMGARGLEPR